MKFDYMICPVQDLATNVLSDMTCVPNPVFTWREFPLPDWATSFLLTTVRPVALPSACADAVQTRQTITQIPWAPFQLHSIVLAIFASLVAPFGGFFASGFKRAFNIKDFGASIPGHGGLTDRMDCQFLMGLFSYVCVPLPAETPLIVWSEGGTHRSFARVTSPSRPCWRRSCRR